MFINAILNRPQIHRIIIPISSKRDLLLKCFNIHWLNKFLHHLSFHIQHCCVILLVYLGVGKWIRWLFRELHPPYITSLSSFINTIAIYLQQRMSLSLCIHSCGKYSWNDFRDGVSQYSTWQFTYLKIFTLNQYGGFQDSFYCSDIN